MPYSHEILVPQNTRLRIHFNRVHQTLGEWSRVKLDLKQTNGEANEDIARKRRVRQMPCVSLHCGVPFK